MFADTKAFSGFAVDDVDKAREFYGGTLGLKTSEENGLLTLHIAGDRPTLVYPKKDHTPGGVHHPELPGGRHRGCRRRAGPARRELPALPPASSRTRRASHAATKVRRSRGSPTPPATSCPCSSWTSSEEAVRMTEHKVGTRAEWLAARKELLEREKELTRRSDELARAAPGAAVGARGQGVRVRDERRAEDAAPSSSTGARS